MKKLDLMGGRILRRLIETFRAEKTEVALSAIFACLRDSEVFVPVRLDFADADLDYSEDAQIPAKKIEMYPFYVEDDDGGRYLVVYSWLDQMKESYRNENTIKLSFLKCMSWALSWPKIKGIVLDVETTPFTVFMESFDDIAGMKPTAEDEYVYAKVRFKAGGKAYYYETTRQDLAIGSKVIVPFGQYNKQKIGTIVEIEKYNSDNLPHSYFSTKYILRKVDEEEAVPRKRFLEKILLQEQESYDIIKDLIEREKLFSFDAYYNQIFGEEDRCYNPSGDWKVGEITLEQRKDLTKRLETAFDELDKTKPIMETNSVGVHYANELFYERPNRWCYNGDPFLWGYLARKFSSVQLPLTEDAFTELFDDFLSFIPFPEEAYVGVKIPAFSYKEYTRRVTRSSVDSIRVKLLKNLKKFDERMAELNQKDVYLVSGKKLTTAFGERVKITKLNGGIIQGEIVGFSVGDNDFVSLNVQTDKGTKKITIDEISKFSNLNENPEPDETETAGALYCFVGVSPQGKYDCNYWYIDESGKTQPGTYVWVQMGRKNEEQIVFVDSVQYCTAADAPYDVHSAKRILRQCTKEESEEADLDW